MCATSEDLNKSAHWPESFVAVFCSEYHLTSHIMHRPDHPKHSKNEEQVVTKVVDFLTMNYDIVLSSVLFGYGTFICINKIDIVL